MSSGPTPTPDSPKDLPCDTCKATAGSPCKRPSGHAVFGGGFHAPRRKAFEAARRAPTSPSLGPLFDHLDNPDAGNR